MSKKIIIAIDGYSSTGKSTLAKELAKELKYMYLDTGAMYRMVTLFAMQNNIIDKNNFDKKLLIKNLKKIKINFVYNKKLLFSEAYLNNKNVEKKSEQ